jgi:hypothetical protein
VVGVAGGDRGDHRGDSDAGVAMTDTREKLVRELRAHAASCRKFEQSVSADLLERGADQIAADNIYTGNLQLINDGAHDRIRQLEAALREIRELVDGYIDIIDCEYSPLPNLAMRVDDLARQALAAAGEKT